MTSKQRKNITSHSRVTVDFKKGELVYEAKGGRSRTALSACLKRPLVRKNGFTSLM